MSYDIYFIKKKDLQMDNIYSILETESNKSDDYFIPNSLMRKLKLTFAENGLKFEMFGSETEDQFELNFPTYQVSIFNSQVVISLPYWDSNSTDNIANEVKIITNVLIEKENGFTGFDPQTEVFIREKYDFRETFTETLDIVEGQLEAETNGSSNSLTYIGIGVTLILIVAIIWKWALK